MISVVIPVFNNAETLPELTQRLVTELQILQPYEIIYINDGSRDNSFEILTDLAKQNNNIKIISFSKNYGQHPAISAGFERAQGDYIVLMDADLQDNPSYIPQLITKLSNQVDVVYTIKSRDTGYKNRLTSSMFQYVFSKIVSQTIPSHLGVFRAFTRKFLNAILQYNERNIIYGPLMFYMGFNYQFIEVKYGEYGEQKSNYSFKKRLTLALNTLISYTDIPHRLLIYTGVVLVAAIITYAFILLMKYIIFGKILMAGFTTIVLLLLLILGSIMTSAGILGIYLFRVYQEVLKRPRYLIKDTINLN